jgi:hypothetical protein
MANNIVFIVDEYLQQPDPGYTNLLSFNLNGNRFKGNSSYVSVSTGPVSNIVQLTGTVKGSTSSNTILGQSSLFDLELSRGDRIRVTGFTNNTVVRVHSITGAQTMIVTPRPPVSFTTAANVYIRKLETKAPEKVKIGANGHTIALKSLTVGRNFKAVGNGAFGYSPLGGDGLKVTYDTSTGSSYINNTYTDGSLYFQTVNTSRVIIDKLGRVTMPYQPCFYAYGGAANPTLSGTAQALVFTTAATNIGSYYSTTTGKFTAPVAGNYIFHWHFVQTGALTGPLVYLFKNGGNVSTAAIAYGTSYNNAAASAIITLAASDYVQLYGISFNSTSPVIDMNYCGFSGHLVG